MLNGDLSEDSVFSQELKDPVCNAGAHLFVLLVQVVNYLRVYVLRFFFFFKQKTAYEISECDWSSDVCSSDRKSTRLNSSHIQKSRMPSSASKQKKTKKK